MAIGEIDPLASVPGAGSGLAGAPLAPEAAPLAAGACAGAALGRDGRLRRWRRRGRDRRGGRRRGRGRPGGHDRQLAGHPVDRAVIREHAGPVEEMAEGLAWGQLAAVEAAVVGRDGVGQLTGLVPEHVTDGHRHVGGPVRGIDDDDGLVAGRRHRRERDGGDHERDPDDPGADRAPETGPPGVATSDPGWAAHAPIVGARRGASVSPGACPLRAMRPRRRSCAERGGPVMTALGKCGASRRRGCCISPRGLVKWGYVADLGSFFDSIRTSAGHASPALLALIFLVTPTAIWIAYRLMFGRSGKRMPKSTIAYLWGCPVCHSANQPADQTCYGCGSRIDRFATVTLIDAVTMQVVASLDVATMTPTAPDTAVEAKPMVSVGLDGRPRRDPDGAERRRRPGSRTHARRSHRTSRRKWAHDGRRGPPTRLTEPRGRGRLRRRCRPADRPRTRRSSGSG